MTATVDFLAQAELDLIEFVPFEQHVLLLQDIIDRLSAYPEIGVRLEPPDQFARAHHFGDWLVYWETIRDSLDVVVRVDVLRVVPDAFSRLDLSRH